MARERKSGPGGLLKSNFDISSKIDAFYTGGKVQFSSDEDHLFCTCNDKIQVVQIQTGKVVQTLQEEGDVVNCFASSPDDKFCVTASRSLLLRQWNWRTGEQIRTWKAVHKAPIVSMVFDSTSTLLATGSSDSTVKVWDIIKQYYTHNFKGSQGVVSLVAFHPNAEILQLFSASDDCKIRVWDLKRSRCAAVLESHFSIVTSLAFSQSGNSMISSSRDNVLNVWDLSNKKIPKTIPAFEGVESVVMLPKSVHCPGCDDKEKEYFITAGSKGQLRVWSLEGGKCVFTETVINTRKNDNKTNYKEGDDQQIVYAALCENLGMIAVVTFDHNIVFHELQSLKRAKQFVGYNDEILDLCFAGSDETHLAVATNSSELRMYDLASMNCLLLEGHTDIVLALEINNSGDALVTGSKDNTVRIWEMNEHSEFRCVAIGVGHTHAVSTVAWSRASSSFIASGSQDNTIKIWNVPATMDNDSPVKLSVRLNEKAHDKDINSVTISPNDKLLASGSQDKTAKIWNISNGSPLGTLRGHKKGIWCVRFSPVDQCVATSSADSTIKIWSLSDLTCVKTFEGHTSSVLKICFLTKGMQLMSSGSEGLLKLWTIKTNECVKTFDQHLDKVWSIAINKSQEQLVSGGADSVINIWKDVTEIEQEQAQAAKEESILKQQELSNLIANKKYLEAIGLAITLEQPFRVLNIMKDILCVQNGTEELTKALKSLREDQLGMLFLVGDSEYPGGSVKMLTKYAILSFMVEWNTNSKNCHVAQTVLSIILKNNSPYELANRKNMKDILEALLPYSEKHFQRMGRLLQQMEFIEYTWQSMKLSGSEFTIPQSIGAATEAASTSDSAMDRRLTRLGESSNESGASSSRLDLLSTPGLSRGSGSVDSDDDERVVSGVDDHGNTGSGSKVGTSDHEIIENGHKDRTSDQDITEKDGRDEMSDQDDSVENSAPNGMNVNVDNEEERETVDAVLKKKRKIKKNIEGESLKIKKAKLKALQQGTKKKKIRTGVGIKTKGKIKLKTRTS